MEESKFLYIVNILQLALKEDFRYGYDYDEVPEDIVTPKRFFKKRWEEHFGKNGLFKLHGGHTYSASDLLFFDKLINDLQDMISYYQTDYVKEVEAAKRKLKSYYKKLLAGAHKDSMLLVKVTDPYVDKPLYSVVTMSDSSSPFINVRELSALIGDRTYKIPLNYYPMLMINHGEKLIRLLDEGLIEDENKPYVRITEEQKEHLIDLGDIFHQKEMALERWRDLHTPLVAAIYGFSLSGIYNTRPDVKKELIGELQTTVTSAIDKMHLESLLSRYLLISIQHEHKGEVTEFSLSFTGQTVHVHGLPRYFGNATKESEKKC